MRKPKPPPNAPWPPPWPEITDHRVLDAVSRVDRAAFVPAELRPWAKADIPLAIGQDQTISQPYVVALMTQALDLLARPAGAGDRHRLRLSNRPALRAGQNVHGRAGRDGFLGGALSCFGEKGGNWCWNPWATRPIFAWGMGRGAGRKWPRLMPSSSPPPPWPCRLPCSPNWPKADAWSSPSAPETRPRPCGWCANRTASPTAQSLCGVRFVPLVSPLLDDPAQHIKIKN